jgi:hypothetical protein
VLDVAELHLFTHPLQVQVFLLLAVAGVRFKYALSALLKRSDLLMGLGTPATGHELFSTAAAASSTVHTPDAEV